MLAGLVVWIFGNRSVQSVLDLEAARVTLVVLLGLGGWFLAARVNLPAPGLLGPMILVGLATVAGVPSHGFPHWLRVLVQSIIGGYLGLKIDRATIASTRSMLFPVAVSTVWFVLSTLLIGYALARWTTIDLYSALLASTTGGVAEMTAIAISVHADVALVATMQVMRLITSNVAVPFLVRREAYQQVLARSRARVAVSSLEPTRRWSWLACIGIGAVGGFGFDALHVPAGGVIGGMLAVAAVRLANVPLGETPARWRTLAQVFLGVFVGISFSSQTLIELQNSFAIILGALLAVFVSTLPLAFAIQRWMRVDAVTAILACTPGGLTVMPVLADELGAQTFVVSLFQFARIVLAILVMPIIFQILTKF